MARLRLSHCRDSFEHFLANVYTLAAVLGAKAAMFVHAGVLLTFLGANAAGRGAGTQEILD